MGKVDWVEMHMVLLIFNGDFIESFLRTGDCDIDEVLFLLFHPGLGGELGRHPSVASEEINGWPFEPFGLVDGGEG